MSSRGGNTEQPSNPDPARLSAEHALLGLAAISLTAAIVALVVEEQTTVVVLRGGYSILTGLFVVGLCGWLVRSAEWRVTQRIEALAEKRYQDGYDDGFVDGAASGETSRRVEPMHGRRMRPRLTGDS